MPDREEQKITRGALKTVRGRLRLTRAAIALERTAHSFWPLISWTLVVLGVVLLGVLPVIGTTGFVITAGFAGFIWLLLFAKGVREFDWPSSKDASDRLDRSLPGRPLEALNDTQAIGQQNSATRALWMRHLMRMAQAAKASKATQPNLQLATRDPWALRLVAIFLFASAFVFVRGDGVSSIADTLQPAGSELAGGASWEGWAEPPSYTGKPAVYLNSGSLAKSLELPQGTKITLRVYGMNENAKLRETVSQLESAKLLANQSDLAEVTFVVQKGGHIELTPPRGDVVAWDVTVIGDTPPEVFLTGDVTRTVQGAVQMPFQAVDDYGIVGGTVTIELALDQVDRRHGLSLEPEPVKPVVLDIPLPFGQNAQAFEDTVTEDLADHPWAGLPVRIVMQVQDDAGQVGQVMPEVTPMPGKRFFDDMAGTVAEQRRDLLWNRNNSERVVQILKAATYQPEIWFKGKGDKAYLMIRTAIRRMQYNGAVLSDEVRDEVAELLWRAALLIEDGDLADARERLKRAQDRLSEAMKNGATPDEIAELMDELRRATQEFMKQLAREQRENGDQNQQAENQNGQEMTQDQLQELMDRIQELMEQGRMAEAQELMQQLQQMMENMRVTESQNGQNGENQQAMEGLNDTLREQQGLADETFRQLQEEFNRNSQQGQQEGQQEGQQPGQRTENGDRQGGDQQQGQQPGQGRQGQGSDQQGQGQGQGENHQSPNDLAERQEALRQMLEQQRGQIGQSGPGGEELNNSLDEAERQMGEAQKNLENGDAAGALDNQSNAMEALRDGMRQLNEEQRRQAQQPGQPGQGMQPGNNQAQRRDPLGRPLSESGRVGSDEKLLQDEEKYRRSREVMDEIRRRSGDRSRPTLELDYLRRLLDRF